jgi:hypothetical protein
MATEAQERLARALETLALNVASAPRSVVGMKVSAVAGPGSSGNVTGMKVTATGGPGSGNVTGLNVQVSAGGDDAARGLVQELREAAVAVRQDKGHRSWIQGLLSRVGSLADRAVDATAMAGVQEALKTVFG